MSFKLNDEWQAWIVKTPPKDFFHDQKVREEVSGGTSFLWHPARYWTVGGGGEGKIKGGFDPQLRGLQF